MNMFFLFSGLLIGVVATWLIANYRFLSRANGIPEAVLQERYVLKEIHQNVQLQADMYRDDLMNKEQEIRQLSQELAAKNQELRHIGERLQTHQQEVEGLQRQFRMEFENVANRLLEEKSQKFTLQNHEQLTGLLQPLREKILDFEQGIERKFIEETKERSALRIEVEQLRLLNTQLSNDAHNLVRALKGDSKVQGDWGELRLEMLLEKAGLLKDIHFMMQNSFTDRDGNAKRPDFIVQLPGDKHLVIDSKVSLTAYEQFHSCGEEIQRGRFLKSHVDSLRNHVRDLSSKNYQHLYQINTPDYLLLFVPIEPAFFLAQQEDPRLFTDALDKNIVIVTPATLLTTMRTVSYIWRQEKQRPMSWR